MKKLFQRKNGDASVQKQTTQNKRRIGSLEDRLAKRLELATSGFSKGRLILAFGIFIVLFGSACTVLFVRGITGSTQAKFVIEQLKKLPEVLKTGEPENTPNGDLRELLDYKKYLDSIATDPGSRDLYRDFLKVHPGLPDSLDRMIRNYGLN